MYLHVSKELDRASPLLNMKDIPGMREMTPLGHIVAVIDITGSRKYGNVHELAMDERLHLFTKRPGNFPLYGLEIGEVVPLKTPVKCRGQGELWTVPDDVLAKIEEVMV